MLKLALDVEDLQVATFDTTNPVAVSAAVQNPFTVYSLDPECNSLMCTFRCL